MKKLYIFSAFLDILEYLARCISNLVDKFTKRNKNYEEITSIEYSIDKKDIDTSVLIYNKDKHSLGIENTWDKKISLESNKFESIIYYLKKHNVLQYKKYYHSLEFHSYSDMTEEDNTDNQESITITFKDGTKRTITSLDNNKKVSNIIDYLKQIN
jgi:hypothetical protein